MVKQKTTLIVQKDVLRFLLSMAKETELYALINQYSAAPEFWEWWQALTEDLEIIIKETEADDD
jgi:hypothetical protein